jgi:hypothetical protein
MTFTTGQTLTAAVLNSNPTTFSGCFNNLDSTNIGAAGLYASGLLPTNSSQATFGGSQLYTFPNGVAAGGPVTGTTGTFSAGVSGTTGAFSSGVSGTTGAFSSTVSNAGSTSTGAVQQTVSGTTYTAPYDAQSTAGGTSTHLERGELTTSAFSSGFACATHSFAKAYTANPIVTGLISGNSATQFLYLNSKSTTSFQLCVFESGASGGTALLEWISLGE